MTPIKSVFPTGRTAPPLSSAAAVTGMRPLVTERGLPIAVQSDSEPESDRVILYERLTGDAARQRAASPEPQGAGMAAEEVAKIEYVEIWSTPSPAGGYDFRMYSYGGALIAARSTRA